jgi:hypothetical protein
MTTYAAALDDALSTFKALGAPAELPQLFSDLAHKGVDAMTTYAAALDDALSTFKALGAPAELPQLFSDLAHKGVDAGLSDKALTALVELLGND